MKSLLVLFVAMAFFATGEALKCYGCFSSEKGCADPFDESAVKEITCAKGYDTCVKASGDLSNGTSLTIRDCYVSLNIEGILGRAAANVTLLSISGHACDTDLCNGVSSTGAALSMLMVLVVPFSFRNYY